MSQCTRYRNEVAVKGHHQTNPAIFNNVLLTGPRITVYYAQNMSDSD